MIYPPDDLETTTPSQPWEADGNGTSYHRFNMINVGAKTATQRRAIAQGQILLSHEAFIAIRDRKNPKGDVLALAEVAGIMSAKKTSDLLPLCHPLPLEQVKLSFVLDEKELSVVAFCEVATTAKTGVEMEALSGVNGALLAIYDLSKAVNPVLTLSNIRLNVKEGGKSGTWFHPDFRSAPQAPIFAPIFKGIRSAVFTISDRATQGTRDDTSGPAIVSFLEKNGGQVIHRQIIPDEKNKIQSAVMHAIQDLEVSLVITTGGTGFSPRDVTPEAIQEISDVIIPGIGERLRSEGARFTSSSYLSRSLGGLVGRSLVIALPGSKKAVVESLEALKDLIPHALHIAVGGDHS